MNVRVPSDADFARQSAMVVEGWAPSDPPPVAPYDRKRVVGGILAEAAHHHSVDVSAILSGKKTAKVSLARFRAMWRLHALKKAGGIRRYSLLQIARFVGLTNHASVLHGLRRYREHLSDVGVDNTIAADAWAVEIHRGADFVPVQLSSADRVNDCGEVYS